MESWFLESLRGYAIRNQRSLNWFITMESRPSVLNAAAGWLSSSFLFARGRTLFEANSGSWNLPMTKWDKLLAGGCLILKDLSQSQFPPGVAGRIKAERCETVFYPPTHGQNLTNNVQPSLRQHVR